LEEGEYDLAVFHTKQALQLCAKHSLYVKYGDYPKMRRLKELLGALGQSYDSLIVDLLEETCIGAGCLGSGGKSTTSWGGPTPSSST